jgi:hypothetical protein
MNNIVASLMDGGGRTGYWQPAKWLKRRWVVRINGELLRDARGNPRRFESREAAVEAAGKSELAREAE